MKLSELISELQNELDDHGDHEVHMGEWADPITERQLVGRRVEIISFCRVEKCESEASESIVALMPSQDEQFPMNVVDLEKLFESLTKMKKRKKRKCK